MKNKGYTKLSKRTMFFSVLIFFAIATKALSVIFPLIIQKAIDAGVQHEMQDVFNFIILLCLVGLINGIIDMIDQVMEKKYSNTIAHNYREKITNYISHLEPNEYSKHEKSEYISIINNNIDLVVNNYYIFILNVIKCILVIVFTISALFSLNGILTVIIVVTASLTVINPFLFRDKLNHQNDNINSSMKNLNSKLDDFLEGYLTGKILLVEKKFRSRVLDASKRLSKDNVKYWKYMQEPNAVSVILTYSRDISLVGVGIYLMGKGTLTVGALFAAVQLSNLLSAPAVNLSYLISSIISTKGIKTELDKMQYTEEDNELTENVRDDALRAPTDIIIKDLMFSYEEKQVLKNINLHIEAGKKYLLVGASGSGKSSLLRILAKFSNDYSGSILVNSSDLKEMGKKEWYSQTSMSMQESVLFHDTLYNNMTLWDGLSNENLQQYIQELNLTSLVEENGMDYDCTNGGSNFSGGEQQRIALIRILLESKALLLIDEATSALDYANYLKVESILLNRSNTTVINITHKIHPEIARQYDCVIFLKQGIVAAVGTYNQLIQNEKEFQEFMQL